MYPAGVLASTSPNPPSPLQNVDPQLMCLVQSADTTQTYRGVDPEGAPEPRSKNNSGNNR